MFEGWVRRLQIRSVVLNYAVLAAYLVLAGCAVQGSAYEHTAVAPDRAAIYVYRTYPTAGIGSAVKTSVTCADQSVRLGPGGYHRFEVDPGDILCSSQTENTAQVQFTAKAGHEYYVKQSLSIGLVVAHDYLEQVGAEAAQADLETCKLQ
jgi:hypothetical protein